MEFFLLKHRTVCSDPSSSEQFFLFVGVIDRDGCTQAYQGKTLCGVSCGYCDQVNAVTLEPGQSLSAMARVGGFSETF